MPKMMVLNPAGVEISSRGRGGQAKEEKEEENKELDNQ